jgi:DNA polymerase-4
MDYFFAQVEERDNPELKGKPVAIGGIMNGRGVLSTSNYEARKYGVRAAMPTALALKKCPHLILVGSHFEKYREASSLIYKVFTRFTDKIEKISLDEAYLDVTDCELFGNDAIAIAKEVKRQIYLETQLTASAGISYNKLLAKIGSDLHKPNGIAVIRPENVAVNIARFPISKIWGVGKVTEERMESMGLLTFGDLQKFTKLDLINSFGDFGASLFSYCRGIDNRDVSNSVERKSLSVEHTFVEDKKEQSSLEIELEGCFDEMVSRLKNHSDRKIKNIFVKIKYFDFESTTIESQLICDFNNFKQLFRKRFTESSKAIRLIGVGVKFYSTYTKGQLELPITLCGN